jgi:cyclin E
VQRCAVLDLLIHVTHTEGCIHEEVKYTGQSNYRLPAAMEGDTRPQPNILKTNATGQRTLRRTMSRKSARLQSRGPKKTSEEDQSQQVTTGSRKRKAEEELERTMEVTKRRQQFQIQNQWIPISETSSVASCIIVPGTEVKSASPQSEIGSQSSTPQELVVGSTFRFQNYFTTPIPMRHSPLPVLQWADSREVWQLMLKKEEMYIRDPYMLAQHPTLQPRMRSILLDWLIEVCEVYRLHRETFYLATDFIDRYLSVTKNVQKQQLQLLGISSLFVAAKLEEIYPPKLAEFAYVTDGACTENEILDQELVLLKALKWDLSPMTVNSWLNVFLQLVNMDSIEEREHNFVFPQYSSHAFIQIARLLDLCFLDLDCLQFSYSILATSAVYHMSSEHVALSVSGYKGLDIAACVQWMAPFAMTLREAGPVELKFFSSVAHEDTHNIQTHAVDLSLLEKAQDRQSQVATSSRASPDCTKDIPGIITPPASTKGKSRNYEPE